MFSHRQSAHSSQPYAIPADFCRIFESDMNRLYLLSYLLTADQDIAEECFVRGLEHATRSNRVFREWAGSWARRMILQNAIGTVRPRASGATAAKRRVLERSSEAKQISAVVALPSFERFVFVMTVLERYSHQECSLLLGCSREDVTAAQFRALQAIGDAAEILQGSGHIDLGQPLESHVAASA